MEDDSVVEFVALTLVGLVTLMLVVLEKLEVCEQLCD